MVLYFHLQDQVCEFVEQDDMDAWNENHPVFLCFMVDQWVIKMKHRFNDSLLVPELKIKPETEKKFPESTGEQALQAAKAQPPSQDQMIIAQWPVCRQGFLVDRGCFFCRIMVFVCCFMSRFFVFDAPDLRLRFFVFSKAYNGAAYSRNGLLFIASFFLFFSMNVFCL